jgi:tetratricopeptide (TPR) repeat protein
MTRTTLYKAHYFIVLFLAAAAALAALAYFRFSPLAIVLIFIALFVPGRILGFFWRDLLRGLRLLNAREFSESKRHSELFLAQVRSQPWIKNLVWLGSSTYSHDPEVLALNNLGAAELNLGERESAEAHFKKAIELDNQCPLPFVNLSILYEQSGNAEEATRCIESAIRLGYGNGVSDKIIRASQTRFANSDGTGASP